MDDGPRYRGLRLDGPIQEFHRAVDRLRWDTVPAPAPPPATRKPTDTAAPPPPAPGRGAGGPC